LGSFGQVWAEIATLTVAESLPKVWLKSLKPHNSETVNPNVTWNVSLESYHPYLLPQEVSKALTTSGTYGSLPKIRKGRFGCLRPLGVKTVPIQSKVDFANLGSRLVHPTIRSYS
jgi:hypothetical protein